jgi:hypothetical protein
MRQRTATQRAPNIKIHVETLPLLLVTLTWNIKSREIFKLNSLNHIIIKVELYRAQTGLMQYYNYQNYGHVWDNCNQQHPRCLWWWRRRPTCIGNALKRWIQESMPSCCNCTLVEGEKPHPASYRACIHAKGEEHNGLPRDSPGGWSLSSSYQSSPTQLRCKTLNTRNHRRMGKVCGTACSHICHNRKFRKQVCQYRLPVCLTRIF